MILVDTNVLVALVDERDRLHARARRDLKRLRGPFGVTSAVLTEACFLLPSGYLRSRLRFLLMRLPMTAIELEPPYWDELFEWLARYDEHTPDFCDAELAVLASRAAHKVWTYDGEFESTWRRSDGSRIPLATRAASKK